MKQLRAFSEWTIALVALVCWFYIGYQFLGLFMESNAFWKLVSVWGATVFLLPAFAAVLGLAGQERACDVLKVSAAFVMFGGLAIGVVALFVMVGRDIVSNVFS